MRRTRPALGPRGAADGGRGLNPDVGIVP